jgi:Ser/Thr protein kinase RdoA (MazF antagonist)
MPMMRLTTLWRAASTVADDGRSPLAEALLARWEADPGSARHVRSSANVVYRCTRAGQPHFLRFAHRGERDRAQIAGECDLLRWLDRAGLRVAVPVPSLAGADVETVATSWGTFHAVLFPALVGEEWQIETLDEAGFRRWGAALGQLHAATARYSGPAQARPGLPDLLATIAAHLPDRPTPRAELAAIRAALAPLPTAGPTVGLCHFDFELDNLRWDDGRAGILDFDEAMRLPFVADLALGDFFATGAGTDDPRFAAFVTGYRAARPLDDAALAQIPLFVRLADLYDDARLARARDLTPDDTHPAWLTRLDERLGNWQARYEARLAQSE